MTCTIYHKGFARTAFQPAEAATVETVYTDITDVVDDAPVYDEFPAFDCRIDPEWLAGVMRESDEFDPFHADLWHDRDETERQHTKQVAHVLARGRTGIVHVRAQRWFYESDLIYVDRSLWCAHTGELPPAALGKLVGTVVAERTVEGDE